MGLRWADGPCGGPGSSLAGYNLGSRLTPASLWCGCFSSWVHRWALSHKLTNLSSLWQLLESKVFCLKLAWCKSTPSHQKKKKKQKLLTSALSTGDAWYPSTLKQCSWVGFPHGHLPPRSEAKGEELVRSCSALLQSQEYVFYRIDSVISYPKSIFFFYSEKIDMKLESHALGPEGKRDFYMWFILLENNPERAFLMRIWIVKREGKKKKANMNQHKRCLLFWVLPYQYILKQFRET